MKEVNICLFLFACLISISSCLPEFYFEEPQPHQKKNQKKFKKDYRGTYICLLDSSTLFILEDKIIQQQSFSAKMLQSDIDSIEQIELKDGFIYSSHLKKPIPTTLKEDTVLFDWIIDTTFFEIAEGQLLRHFKGYYFLNYIDTNKLWTVKTLFLDEEDQLSIGSLFFAKAEIEAIKEITKATPIYNSAGKITNYKLRPTRKELKKILDMHLYKTVLVYKKVSNKELTFSQQCERTGLPNLNENCIKMESKPNQPHY